MRVVLCLFFSFSLTSFLLPAEAQQNKYTIQCIYKLEHQPDSTDIKSRKSENMLLLFNGNMSIFKSQNLDLQDSINMLPFGSNAAFNANFALMRTNPTSFRYTIWKDSTNQMRYSDKIDANFYEYQEPKNIFKWDVLTDTMTISGFRSQKAITMYSGRKWIAWFSSEIPISDGPYKFNGLPGLIVSISDSQSFYSFTLSSIIKKEGNYFTSQKKAQSITKDKYYTSLLYYIENQFEVMAARGVKITSGEAEVRRGIEERKMKNNNHLELSFFQQ